MSSPRPRSGAFRLPDPRRRGEEIEVDPRYLSPLVAATLRCWAADWARLGLEAPLRATLPRRLVGLAERSHTIPLDRLADELHLLARSCERAHELSRAAAWEILDEHPEVAA